MSTLSNTLLAFSMSADAFAASISKGTKLQKPRLADAVRIGLVFGSIETLMPVLGWCAGLAASRFIESVDHWIAFAILATIGCKMIYEGLQGEESDPPAPSRTLRLLVLTAIGTSIDSMAVGVTLALVDANIWLMAAMIGTATFTMATIGIMTGHFIGSKAGRIAEILGGACLCIIGTKILLEHTGFIS
jgi:putative Mn2+ efflux pump MntP